MSILFRIFAKDIKGWSRTQNKTTYYPLVSRRMLDPYSERLGIF